MGDGYGSITDKFAMRVMQLIDGGVKEYTIEFKKKK